MRLVHRSLAVIPCRKTEIATDTAAATEAPDGPIGLQRAIHPASAAYLGATVQLAAVHNCENE